MGVEASEKPYMVIAVEVNDNQIGRIRLKLADSASAEDLLPFIEEAIERGSTVISDGWYPYSKLKSMGYNHEIVRNEDGKTENLLPHVHTIASLVKRWILGTFQGSCSKEHFGYYLDEYAFRYNRKKSNSRGLLFQRLLENAVQIEATKYKNLIHQ